MAIELPTNPAPSAAEPFLQDFGGELVPFAGGPVQRINRIGTRLGLRVTMPPMRGEVARQFQSRLLRGKHEKVIMPWPLLDLEPTGTTGSVSSGAAGGSAVSISGGPFVEGQPISFIHSDGHRSIHIVTGSSGTSVGIFPPLRAALASGNTVEIEQPMIEGYVSPGDELVWSMALEHTMGFSFSIVEAR